MRAKPDTLYSRVRKMKLSKRLLIFTTWEFPCSQLTFDDITRKQDREHLLSRHWDAWSIIVISPLKVGIKGSSFSACSYFPQTTKKSHRAKPSIIDPDKSNFEAAMLSSPREGNRLKSIEVTRGMLPFESHWLPKMKENNSHYLEL